MTALCDRPNLTADKLRHMLSLAMPSLEWAGGFDYVTNNGDFIKYYPDALPQHRWQLTEILLDCANYRHTRKDGSQGRKTKRVSKRFETLLDAITYYETEIKK
jgi:hypothetical protein